MLCNHHLYLSQNIFITQRGNPVPNRQSVPISPYLQFLATTSLLSIYLAIDGNLGCFYLLAVVNSSAMNMCIYFCLSICFQFF